MVRDNLQQDTDLAKFHLQFMIADYLDASMQVLESELHPDWQSDDIRVFKLRIPALRV